MTASKQKLEAQHGRADGRRSLLVYLMPDTIRDLKKAALDQNRHVYEIAEEAFAEWLSHAKSRAKRLKERSR